MKHFVIAFFVGLVTVFGFNLFLQKNYNLNRNNKTTNTKEIDMSIFGEVKQDTVNLNIEEQLTYLDGTDFSYENLETDSYLIIYWSTYCPPCIEKFPLLDTISRENEDIKILLISDETKETLDNFLARRNKPKNVIFLKQNIKNSQVGVIMLPTMILIENRNAQFIEKNDLYNLF